jgi:hypothetical protein
VQETYSFGRTNQERTSQQQAIGVVDMIMKSDHRFREMMSGQCARFTQEEMWEIMTHLNELYINTIYVQQFVDGTFICAVDRSTVNYYLKEEGQI